MQTSKTKQKKKPEKQQTQTVYYPSEPYNNEYIEKKIL